MNIARAHARAKLADLQRNAERTAESLAVLDKCIPWKFIGVEEERLLWELFNSLEVDHD